MICIRFIKIFVVLRLFLIYDFDIFILEMKVVWVVNKLLFRFFLNF